MNIYIAGKITGLEWDYVVEKFEKSEKLIESLGHIPVNPVKLVPKTASNPEAMKILYPVLLAQDAIYLQKDWKKSVHANLELRIAESVGMPIYHEYKIISSKRKLKKLNKEILPTKVSLLGDILEATSQITGISKEDILSRRRDRQASDARKLLCRASREFAITSIDAGIFINRDHATVLVACQQADFLRISDRLFSNQYAKVVETVKLKRAFYAA